MQRRCQGTDSQKDRGHDHADQNGNQVYRTELSGEFRFTVPGKIRLNGIFHEHEIDKDQVQEEADATFGENPIQTQTTAQVDITEEDNAEEAYAETDTKVKGIFAPGFDINGVPARITLQYSITNPNPTISISGAAPGSVTATVSANGRFVDGPMLSWVGEDGPEYIIPVGADKRDRGLDLWMAAGEALGVGAFADGGFVDATGTEPSWAASAVGAYGNGGGGGGSSQPVNVQVSMNPVFNVSGSNLSEERLLDMIRAHLSEISDSVAGELAAKLETIFKNMPTEVA